MAIGKQRGISVVVFQIEHASSNGGEATRAPFHIAQRRSNPKLLSLGGSSGHHINKLLDRDHVSAQLVPFVYFFFYLFNLLTLFLALRVLFFPSSSELIFSQLGLTILLFSLRLYLFL